LFGNRQIRCFFIQIGAAGNGEAGLHVGGVDIFDWRPFLRRQVGRGQRQGAGGGAAALGGSGVIVPVA
jgi:hypothetical protein